MICRFIYRILNYIALSLANEDYITYKHNLYSFSLINIIQTPLIKFYIRVYIVLFVESLAYCLRRLCLVSVGRLSTVSSPLHYCFKHLG